MIQATVAIADFMMILLQAVLWTALSTAGVIALGLLSAGAAYYGVRSLLRRARARL